MGIKPAGHSVWLPMGAFAGHIENVGRLFASTLRCDCGRRCILDLRRLLPITSNLMVNINILYHLESGCASLLEIMPEIILCRSEEDCKRLRR